MKKNNISRDDKRRLLLNKKYELSYSFDNEKLRKDNGNIQANEGNFARPDGTVLRAVINKYFRTIIAVIVALSIAVPSLFFVTLRGKAEDTGLPRLQFGSDNRLVVGDEGLPEGSYLKDIDGKDYTYNLDRDYTKGDVLVYNPSTNEITAEHNPSRNNNLVNITTPVAAGHINDNGSTVTIELSGEEHLEPDTNYYYYDGSTYYMFSFSDETIGIVNGDDYDASNSDPTTRTHAVPEQNDYVKIVINKSSGSAVYSDDSAGYDRRTIYSEADTFEENGVYVVTLVDGDEEFMLTYNIENSGTKKTAWTTRDSAMGISYWNSHSSSRTVFTPYALEAFPFSFDGAPTFYDDNHNELSYSTDKYYYDSTDAQLNDVMFSGTNVLPELQAISSGTDDYWFLRGYDLANYTEDKTFGSIYNKDNSLFGTGLTDYNEDLFNSVFLFNLFTGTYYFQTDRNSYLPNVNYSNGSIWKYDSDNSRLVNDKFELNSINNNAQYLGIEYPAENDTDQTVKVTRSATGNTNKLYKMEDVYTQSELPGIYGYSDQAETRSYYPSIISYTQSSQTVEGLKTSKTVTETNDPDLFHVKLEGYMTSRSLKLPTTDIVLVLDTSGRMDDVLYKRDYKNLNTQTIFEEVSLSGVTHDDLFDKYNPRNSQFDILPGRDYTDNKYVEDPNSPGTYVYLAQIYSFNGRHHYQYTFTSSTGAVYKSPVYDKRILGSIIGNVNSLTFTRQGSAHASNSVRSVTLDSFYARTGENANTALADTTTMSLYNYAHSSRGLYYKHTDGQYYPVTVERLDYDSDYDYYKTYKFSVTVDGKTYTTSYGNDYYGAKDSVFQGFKTYKTENGKLVVDLENSLPSKSLYTRELNTEVTRMDAMKEAMEDLLININLDTRIKGADTRVAVTTFSNTTTEKIPYHLGDVDMNDTRAVDAMISDLYGYTATNATFNFGGLIKTKKARIDIGTQAANTEFRTNSPEGNKRYEVVFTAGVPTKSNDGSVDLSVANAAISNTYTAKTTYGATVYSVGLFDYADETHTHGDYFYYTLGYPWYPCSGKVGSTWGKSAAFQTFDNKEVDPIAADVTNRMLNYMSSNYGDATTSGLSTSSLYNPGYLADPVTYFLSTHGKGYRINRNFSRTTEDNYYFGISPVNRVVDAENQVSSDTNLSADDLEARFREVFGFIAEGMSSPLTELDGGTVLYDGITDYYDIEGMDTSTLRAYAADINTGNEIQVNDNITATLSENKKNIEVTGFNYSNHYIGGSSPAKLVVEFDIRRTENFIGGNRVPTNTTNSAIIDNQGHLEEKFNIPAIDLYLDKDEDIANDQSVYYSYEADLTKAFNLSDVNGKNNAYVDLVYEIYDSTGNTLINTYTISHGETVGHWENDADADLNKMYPQITEDKTYVVKCTVEPWLEGTIDDQEIPENNYPTAYVYVLKPHMSATDLRISAAQDVDVDGLVSDNVTWKHDTNANWSEDKNKNVPNPNPEIFPPELEYKLKDITDGHSGTEYNPFATDNEGNPVAMSDIRITEDTHFQIIDLKIAERTFNYEVRRWIVEDVEILDDEGNGTGEYEHSEYWDDVAGSIDRSAVSLTFDGNTPTAYYVNEADLNGDRGKNPSDAARPNGKFTVLMSKPYDLYLTKIFTGDYVVPEGVVFTIAGDDNSSQTVTIDTFNHLRSDPTKASTQLQTGVTYTISEGFVDEGTDESDYGTSYAGNWKDASDVSTSLSDLDGNDNETFKFTVANSADPAAAYIEITNADLKEAPAITGVSNSERHLNPFFIAAAVIILLGGSGTAYVVKRKSETEA